MLKHFRGYFAKFFPFFLDVFSPKILRNFRGRGGCLNILNSTESNEDIKNSGRLWNEVLQN